MVGGADAPVRYRCGCAMDARAGPARCPEHGEPFVVVGVADAGRAPAAPASPASSAPLPLPPVLLALTEAPTDRELEIARAVARGLSDADIARTLDLSPHTVRAHVNNLARKIEGEGRPRWKVFRWYTEHIGPPSAFPVLAQPM